MYFCVRLLLDVLLPDKLKYLTDDFAYWEEHHNSALLLPCHLESIKLSMRLCANDANGFIAHWAKALQQHASVCLGPLKNLEMRFYFPIVDLSNLPLSCHNMDAAICLPSLGVTTVVWTVIGPFGGVPTELDVPVVDHILSEAFPMTAAKFFSKCKIGGNVTHGDNTSSSEAPNASLVSSCTLAL